MKDTGHIREDAENSRNTGGKPPYDSRRAQVHEQRTRKEGVSINNEHSDRAESSSHRQEKHVAGTNYTRLALPPILIEAQQYISESDQKEWEKQSRKNLEKLNEQKRELEILKFGGRFQDFIVTLSEHYIKKRNLSSDSASVRILYALAYIRDNYIINPENAILRERFKTVKVNLTNSLNDMLIHEKQISTRMLQEWGVVREQVKESSLPSDHTLEVYQGKRGNRFYEAWGEVIKGWAEHYEQMMRRPIDVTRDLNLNRDFSLNDNNASDSWRLEIALEKLIPDNTERSRLFHLED